MDDKLLVSSNVDSATGLTRINAAAEALPILRKQKEVRDETAFFAVGLSRRYADVGT